MNNITARRERVSYKLWNEFINNGDKYTINPMPSNLTLKLKFLDKMLSIGKINRIKHYILTKKVKAEYDRFYKVRKHHGNGRRFR